MFILTAKALPKITIVLISNLSDLDYFVKNEKVQILNIIC